MKRSPLRRAVGLKRTPMKRSLKPIAFMSKRRARYLRSAAHLKVQWQGQRCVIQSVVCTGWGEGTHHILPRGRGGNLEAAERDGPTPVVACNACNTFVSEHPRWATEAGWLISSKGRAA